MMQPAKYVKRSGKGCTTPTLESLEGRLLLSSAPYIYHDPDGDVAKITLSGAGTMDAPTLGANGISSIYLENTSSASSVLTITLTSRTRTSDGLIKIGFIDALTDGAGMKSINAPKVDLTGQGISMTGWLGSVTVHDLLGATTQIGAWTVDGTGHLIAWPHATKVVVHNVGDGAAIVMSSYITSLTANRFGVGSKLHATVLQNVKVNGAFLGSELQSDEDTGTINVVGQATGTWSFGRVSGNVGKITVGSSDANWELDAKGYIKFLTSNSDMNYASIRASGIETLTVKGAMSSSGEFELGGAGYHPGYLKTAVISGAVSGVWNIASGNAGNITVGSASDWDVNVNTTVTSLSCHGNLGLTQWTSASLGTLSVRGNMTGGLMVLSRATDPRLFALGTATVKGYVSNVIRATGNINTVTVGDIHGGGRIEAGARADAVAITSSTVAADYLVDTAAKINSITVNGLTGVRSMANGTIIAGRIVKGVFKNVDIDGGGALAGVAATKFNSLSVTEGHTTYKWNSLTSAFAPVLNTGHFTVRTLA